MKPSRPFWRHRQISLYDQIFTNPIHWARATDSLETASHATDFGPALSGIGGLREVISKVNVSVYWSLAVRRAEQNGAKVFDVDVTTVKEKWWRKSFVLLSSRPGI